jgi:hypothetical protein
LAHFHYCYKGQQLFTPGFDWNAPRVRRMARLDVEQTIFMSQCRDVVVKRGKVPPSHPWHGLDPDKRKAPAFAKVNHSDLYHEKWWYTSQLFDPDWTPRDTLEHAPPAETVSDNVA